MIRENDTVSKKDCVAITTSELYLVSWLTFVEQVLSERLFRCWLINSFQFDFAKFHIGTLILVLMRMSAVASVGYELMGGVPNFNLTSN